MHNVSNMNFEVQLIILMESFHSLAHLNVLNVLDVESSLRNGNMDILFVNITLQSLI